jgi:DNA adenine methylase
MVIMKTTLSPLRYPGGKARQYPKVVEIIKENSLLDETYIEPFAGGAGLALNLLMKGDMKKIVLNDSDIAIYSFWYSIINYSDDFCEQIEKIEVNIEEWERQRYIFSNWKNFSDFDLGMATFYLNRTNFSGILKAGVLGGKGQNNKNTMDVRFNKSNLIERIQQIKKFKDDIILYNMDVFDFFDEKVLNKYPNAFINFDPPYVKKGKGLYNNFFTEKDHERLFYEINNLNREWIVTYDTHPLISKLYRNKRMAHLSLNYSAKNKQNAKEFIIFSDNMVIPKNIFEVL